MKSRCKWKFIFMITRGVILSFKTDEKPKPSLVTIELIFARFTPEL